MELDFQNSRGRISFVHEAYPTDCVSPNLMSIEGVEEFPGFGGTGFFARRGNEVFYVTARHCFTQSADVDIGKLVARLHIPYALAGKTSAECDYVQFKEVISLKHNSDDIPGKFVDVLVLSIGQPTDTSLYEKLMARAVKLPPNGGWLDNFVQHPAVKPDFEDGRSIRFSAIGYPRQGTESNITYLDGKPSQIITQSAKIAGYLGKGSSIERYSLNDLSWEDDLDGFSGSPVIVGFKNRAGLINYALAGMLVSGGQRTAHFVRISQITEALPS